MKQIKIIYEDKRIMAINKPDDMVTSKEGKVENTVEDWLKENFTWSKELARGGLVHRLDKGTSGVLLVAKDKNSLDYLKGQFKDRTIYKEYVALVEGEVGFEGEIKAPIGRSKYNFLKWAVDVDGKEAWTKFERIKLYERKGKKYSLIKVVLKSGRTHQIRVHFSYLGWPLVGDSLYGGKKDMLSRPFLHSKKIAGVHPDGHNFEVESEISDDLGWLISNL